MFDRLEWNKDHMRIAELLFRLEHCRSDNWTLGDKYFNLYKVKPLFDQYAKLFEQRKWYQAQNILELGMWDGGSLVIWNEVFSPAKIVGVDLKQRENSQYFQEYLLSRKPGERVRTYWGVDQANCGELRRIVRDEFDQPLDVVFDDASHLYQPTKLAFETLFPLLRPGGLYIIEDWAWLHWPEFNNDPYFAGRTSLTELVVEIVEMIGSARGESPAILTVQPGFVVVEKGQLGIAAGADFKLDDMISRRTSLADDYAPPPGLVRTLD